MTPRNHSTRCMPGTCTAGRWRSAIHNPTHHKTN